MEYCLDANIFIQAKNFHYHFDICPGFWTWLDQANGTVGSITPICKELEAGKDELKDWAVKTKPSGFFIEAAEEPVQKAVGEISLYVSTNFRPHVAAEFLAGADPWLIAYAYVHECTVVTHETYDPLAKRKVFIPVVCQKFGVPYTDCYNMLRSLGASFVLDE